MSSRRTCSVFRSSLSLGKEALEAVACIVTPETILRWHRELVAKKFDGTEQRKAKALGRPAT
jgi:hypothetical protein